jgi:hypothetical protein
VTTLMRTEFALTMEEICDKKTRFGMAVPLGGATSSLHVFLQSTFSYKSVVPPNFFSSILVEMLYSVYSLTYPVPCFEESFPRT